MVVVRPTEVSLPCRLTSPAAARRFVSTAVAGECDLDGAELLVSEVVTNAVLHAHSSVKLTVDAGDGRIRVGVTDTSTEMPVRRPSPDDGGYGLHLLDSIATDWGVEVGSGTKTVWFEIAESSRPTTC